MELKDKNKITTGPIEYGLENSKKQYVTFSLNNVIYGIEVNRVKEVLYLPQITEVPNTLKFMKGVIDLRGNIIPLIDMRMKFNLPEKDFTEETVTLITEFENQNIGLVVDAVMDVMSFSLEDSYEGEKFTDHIDTNYVENLIKKDEKIIILINIDNLFTESEFSRMKKHNKN